MPREERLIIHFAEFVDQDKSEYYVLNGVRKTFVFRYRRYTTYVTSMFLRYACRVIADRRYALLQRFCFKIESVPYKQNSRIRKGIVLVSVTVYESMKVVFLVIQYYTAAAAGE